MGNKYFGSVTMSIRIAGTGSYIPERILTNADLEKMVDTNDEWIVTRTGISERHIAAENECTSDMAAAACRKALEAAGVDAKEVGAVIVATCTPDYTFPGTAANIHRKLQMGKTFCFDLSAACCGFLSALEVGCGIMLGNKKYRYVLVIGAEKLSSVVNWQDRTTCVLFGDGAGAILLERVDDGNNTGLLASDMNADGNWSEILKLPAGGSVHPASQATIDAHMHTIHMQGQETFKLAVNAMVSACRTVEAEAGIDITKDVKLIIPHQANIRIIQAVAKRLGITEEQVICNISRYGNTSAASVAICFDEAVRTGRLQRGDLALFASFGSGLVWGAQLVRY